MSLVPYYQFKYVIVMLYVLLCVFKKILICDFKSIISVDELLGIHSKNH